MTTRATARRRWVNVRSWIAGSRHFKGKFSKTRAIRAAFANKIKNQVGRTWEVT